MGTCPVTALSGTTFYVSGNLIACRRVRLAMLGGSCCSGTISDSCCRRGARRSAGTVAPYKMARPGTRHWLETGHCVGLGAAPRVLLGQRVRLGGPGVPA